MRQVAILLVSSFIYPLLMHAQTRTLDEYLLAAERYSPLAADYRNQLEAARYDSLLLRASFKPQVSLNGKLMRSPHFNDTGYDIDIVNPAEYTLVGEVTQDILLGKNRNLRSRNLSANRNLLVMNARISMRELRKTIIDQYLTAWSDLTRMQFTKSSADLMKRSQEILKPMVDKGIYKATDYLAFVIESQNEQILLDQLKFQYKTDIDSLNLLCGISDTALPLIAPPVIKSTVKVNGSFFLRPKFTADSIRLITERDLIALRYKPRFSWFADAGLNAVHEQDIPRNFGTSFGVALALPLFDGGQRNLEFRKLDLEESTRKIYSDFYNNQYRLRILQLQQDIEMNNTLINRYREQLKLAETLIDLAGKQLDKGEMPVIDFLNAIRSYKKIQADLNDAEVKQVELVSELNFLNE